HIISWDHLERAKGFEPSTPTLARLCSTTELHPRPIRLASTGALRMPNGPKLCNIFDGFTLSVSPDDSRITTSSPRPHTSWPLSAYFLSARLFHPPNETLPAYHARYTRRSIRLPRQARHRAPDGPAPAAVPSAAEPSPARADRGRPPQEPLYQGKARRLIPGGRA